MTEEIDSNGFFKELPKERRKEIYDWLEHESDRAEATAKDWLEKGQKVVFLLNTGGLLSLLTAAGSLIGDDKPLAPLICGAWWFLAGVILSALSVVYATFYFSQAATETNNLYRQTVSNELTSERNKSEDQKISDKHDRFQRCSLFLIAICFVSFVVGAVLSMNAIQNL